MIERKSNKNSFTYNYPVKVFFGEKAAQKHLKNELAKVGANVLLAYGGGSIRKNGVYDELIGILQSAGKTVTEFTGIMSNPTYAKVQEGAKLARKHQIDFILAVGGGSVIDCCKIVSAQAMGNAEWNHFVFNGMTEKESSNLCITLADTMQEITVTSSRGIIINGARYYPTIQYVEWAINYYRLDRELG